MSWLKRAINKATGRERRDQEAMAEAIILSAEQGNHFSMERLVDELAEEMPRLRAESLADAHASAQVAQLMDAVLEDGLLTPDKEASINQCLARYGGKALSPALADKFERARRRSKAWSEPLRPVQTPLMLSNGEWCAHTIKATACEERQSSQQQAYHYSFGAGILAATNKKLLWVSSSKSISIPLGKIVTFERFSDGLKIIKATGRPILFILDNDDEAAMVRISRVIEELR